MDFDYVNTTEGPNCTQPAIDDFPGDLFTQEQRQAGAVVFHVTVSLYLFAALAVVCDKYFVPAVDIMCNALQMSNDVAGATFMAAATSAPELFVNVIGTFITEGDIGVGTVVGSAVFNILAVAACCGIGAGQVVPLDWWPLTRDCAAYGITVAILICIIHDERVEWYEALILVSLYVVYIAVMYFDKTLQKWARALLRLTDVQNRPSPDGTSLQSEQEEKNPGESYVMSPMDLQQQNGSIGWAPSIHSRSEVEKVDSIPPIAETCVVSTPAPKEHDTEIVLPKVDLISEFLEPREESVEKQGLQEAVVRALNAYDAHTEPKNLDKYVHDLFEWPSERGWFIQVRWIITWPIYLVFMFTIPDCQSNRFRNWYPVTFMMCIVWIGSLSYFVAWMITIIGHTLQIPDSVMGITFLAAGTSVPEAVSSVIVAKKGHGSMGISNSIGSNTFDILLCLGLPWLIKAALIPTIPGHHSVAINSSGLEYSAISLLSTLMMLYLAFFLNKFRLDQRVGRACLGMYAVFLILAILIELNVFFPVNLPTCAF